MPRSNPARQWRAPAFQPGRLLVQACLEQLSLTGGRAPVRTHVFQATPAGTHVCSHMHVLRAAICHGRPPKRCVPPAACWQKLLKGFCCPTRSGVVVSRRPRQTNVRWRGIPLSPSPKALKVLVPLWELFLYSSPFFLRSASRVVAAAGDTPKKVLIASGVRSARL